MKYGLLLQTCNSDILLTRCLLLKISQLEGWKWFSNVFVYLDLDVTTEEFDLIIKPYVPKDVKLHVLPALKFDEWRQNKWTTAFRIYQKVASYGLDFIKFDTDIYLDRLDFMPEFVGKQGFVGRKISFWASAKVKNVDLEFIQGGIVFWGPQARKLILSLDTDEMEAIRAELPNLFTSIGEDNNWTRYERWFQGKLGEDCFVSGILRILYQVPIDHVENLQVSPYDLGINFKDNNLTAVEYYELFSRHDVSAYHYEGSNWGKRITMNKYLKWVYRMSELGFIGLKDNGVEERVHPKIHSSYTP